MLPKMLVAKKSITKRKKHSETEYTVRDNFDSRSRNPCACRNEDFRSTFRGTAPNWPVSGVKCWPRSRREVIETSAENWALIPGGYAG